MTYKQHRCLIKDSLKVREALNARFNKLELTGRAVTNNARDNGRGFSEQALCRYRKHGNVQGAISTEDVMWLCDKYKIKLTLKVTRA